VDVESENATLRTEKRYILSVEKSILYRFFKKNDIDPSLESGCASGWPGEMS